MIKRIAPMIIPLLLCAWGCGDLNGNARRDTDATLASLRAAGITARVELTPDDAAQHLRQLRLRAGSDAILVVISKSQVAVDFPDSLSQRLGEVQRSRTWVWSSLYLRSNDPKGATRAAARGLLVNLMNAGLISPRPVPPLLLMPSDATQCPSYHGTSGAFIVLGVVLLGSYLAQRGRAVPKSPD